MVSALPSKKIFLLIIACLIGVGAISFAVFASKNNSLSNNSLKTESLSGVSGDENAKNVALIEKTLKENSSKDDDADGLLNWEETLWGTDQNNADSDTDGTKDGEEVNTNRNPLKAGPNDKLAATSLGTGNTAASAGSQGGSANGNSGTTAATETAKISRELFANYIEAKKSGTTLDANVQSQIIEKTFANKSLVSTPAKVYSQNDIMISTNPDLRAYGNALGLAFYEGNIETSANEVEILQSALEKESRTEIAKLDPIIAAYAAILKKLLTTPVPREQVASHLEVVNNTNKVLTDIQGFRVIFDDPIIGLITVGSYYKDVEVLQASVKELRNIFNQNGVRFEESDYGYVFFQAESATQ